MRPPRYASGKGLWPQARPWRFAFFLLFLILLTPATACDVLGVEPDDQPQPRPGDLKVLFIGASYLAVNDLPGLFEGMAAAAGKEVFVGRRVQSGHYLDFFAQDGATERAIRDQAWDYVVLSGGCQTAAYPDTHHTIRSDWGAHHPLPALKALKRKVKENNPETVLVYILPWAFEDGLTWVPGQTDDYFEMQEKIRENTLSWADSLDLTVAPVGMAWKVVMEWNLPEHYLYSHDWNHPAPRGSFLSAATVFATVFAENLEGVDYRWVLSETDAEGFRRIGSETVLNDLTLWNVR